MVIRHNWVPQCFHVFAVFGAQELRDHWFPHCRSPYMTSVKEILDPLPGSKILDKISKVSQYVKPGPYYSSCRSSRLYINKHVEENNILAEPNNKWLCYGELSEP